MKSSGYDQSKIALVSREYEQADFRRHLPRLLDVIDELGCNQAVFSLYSLHRKRQHLDLSWIFRGRKFLSRVILETGDLWHETDLRTEVWCHDLDYPQLFIRQFAYSSEARKTKERFMAQFQHRVMDNTAICICGEIGILRINRRSGRAVDDFGYQQMLSKHNVRLILNPFHTKAFRYEINQKRQALSKRNRWCISVWNQYRSRGRDDKHPWAVFYNGKKSNHLVTEYYNIVPSRPDIRVGTLDISPNGPQFIGRELMLISGREDKIIGTDRMRFANSTPGSKVD